MTLLPDGLRLAARRVFKHPGASVASVFTLALGIAAAAVTWSLLSAVLLHPLSVRDPGRLTLVEHHLALGSRTLTMSVVGYPEYLAIRQSGIFQAIAAADTPRQILVGESGRASTPRLVNFVSHDFFETLGVALARGIDFRPDHDRRGVELVAILSDQYWRTAFGASADAIGQTLTIGDRKAVIIGIAPRSFHGLELASPPDVYLPLHAIEVSDAMVHSTNWFDEPGAKSSPNAWIRLIGRLRDGATETDAIARIARLERGGGKGLFLTPVVTAAVAESARDGMSRFATLLTATVALLLLLGCTTVGMLLLVRTEDRRDEFAILLALGASRARLARDIAFEGALMSCAGAVLAVPLTGLLLQGIELFRLPGQIALESLDLALDLRTWVLCAIAALLTTALISFAAAILGLSTRTSRAIHARGGGTPRTTRRWTRTILASAQVAVTVTLAIGAGVFARSLIAALRLNPTIDTAHIVTGSISLTQYGYTAPRAVAFFEDLRRRLLTSGAITSVSIAHSRGGMSAGGQIEIDGVRREMPTFVNEIEVDSNYFRTLGVPLLRGRTFSADDRTSGPLVIMVSAAFGDFIAPGGEPVGHHVTESRSRPPNPPAVGTIVGVVPDVIRSVTDTRPMVRYYTSSQGEPAFSALIVLRTADDASTAISDLERAVKAIDPRVS
ncbi:MAG TPA: ABC transporter permease, partial [Vicinamibacterales bacterium]|nr:ABC transporter permease [Vicinamibacterales bacterium]